MHRIVGWTLLMLLLAAECLPSQARADEHMRLHLVLSDNGAIYQEVAHAITSALNARSDQHIDISVAILEENAALAPRGQGRPPAVLVTVGTRAAQWALQQHVETPVFSVLIPKSAYRELEQSNLQGDAAARKFSAIYLDQPFARQVALARLVLPNARRLGALLGPETQSLAATLKTEAGRLGFEFVSVAIATEKEAAAALRDLTEKVDVIVALHDATVMTPTTAKWLLYMAYQRRVPVIGFSKAYATAGALAAVYSTPEQIGRQAGETLAAWLRHDPSPLGAVQYPAYFSIEVNAAVASSLGVTVPDSQALVRRLEELNEAPK